MDTQSGQQDGISISEAAVALKCSEKTVRRKIKAGELVAYQFPTSQGFEWRVRLGVQPDSAPAVHLNGHNGHSPTHAEQVPTPAGQVDSTALLEALRIVDRLQRENMELAGRLGYYQAQLAHRDERILLLEAGPAPTPPEEPQHTPERPVEPLPSLPWWKRWFALE